MKRKAVIITLVVISLVAAIAIWRFGRSNTGEKKTTNLLLITLDTMRADRLGCYGDLKAHTPAIDLLAQKAALFENCYAPAPLTLPSHCSILTGRWPIAHGVRNNVFYTLPPQEVTLAETLADAGYDTSALIASYVLKKKFGLDQGFSFYNDYLGSNSRVWGIEAQVPADRVYKKFATWLQRPRRAPFFLWVHLYDPHKPYTPPPEFLSAAGGDAYRGEAAFADDAVGKMISDLKERGLLENTLVVIAGDHGEAFGEHVESGHGIFCYEESMRVPLLFVLPEGQKKALRIDQRSCLIDVMPTVLDLLNIPVPDSCQGESLVPVMKGKRGKESRPVYLESVYGKELNNWAPIFALISGKWKYISLPQAELYDLDSDPEEKKNLFLRYNAEARRLDKQLSVFNASRADRTSAQRRTLNAEDKEKLEALGYISSFASTSQAGLDPKIGIAFQERCTELFAAFDRGEIERVESEALRFKEETAEHKFTFVYVLLHHVYEKKQQWKKLEANLLQACEIFRNNPKQQVTFQRNLLEYYYASRNLDAAEKMATEMIRNDSQRTRPLEILGEIARARENWQQALDWFLRALEAEGDDYSLEKKALQMRLKLGDVQGAKTRVDALLTSPEGSRDSDLLFTASMLAVDAGDNARAESLLARLVVIEPTAPRWFDYALLLGRNGKIDKAIALMEKALAAPAGQLDEERRQTALRALKAWKDKRP